MFKDTYGCSVFFILILLPSNIFSINFKTACDLLKLPRECHCQRNRHASQPVLNETRLRCRQLTEITTSYRWSSVSYDHVAFETPNDNLTVKSFAFANIIARTLRFNAQNLILNDFTFDSAYIGQLLISHQDTYGRINFSMDNQIFYGTTITNLYFKSIDFEKAIPDFVFSNSRIYSLTIHSSKFYGFSNDQIESVSKPLMNMKYDHFLDYEIILPLSQKKIPKQYVDSDEFSSSDELEKTVTMNITLMPNPIYITIISIISSINTTSLTENYFPINLAYSQVEEIELNSNQIKSLNAYAFHNLKQFKGRLSLINNQIEYINPYAFADLSLLKNLSLAKNSIQNLSSVHFKDLQGLTELDLSFNQINEFNNNTFKYLFNLQILHLNHNPLRFIHPTAFSSLLPLKQINLQGIDLIHFLDQQSFQWMWNIANLRVTHLLNTDFDLSDVAFCILSNQNKTLFHVSYEHFCSCDIHYFNFHAYFDENTSIPIGSYNKNFLRLTPVCNENETESVLKQQTNESDLVVQGLDGKCDYKLMFLDCDAMTTTTTLTTIISTIETTTSFETETTFMSDTSAYETTEVLVQINTKGKPVTTEIPEVPTDKLKKLFSVIGTLLAITIISILSVFFWYRLKAIMKDKKKKKCLFDQQRHFNSPVINNHNRPHAITVQYASSDTLGSVHSAHLSANKSHSDILFEPTKSHSLTVYKNFETIENDPVDNFIDDESSQQDLTENLKREIKGMAEF